MFITLINTTKRSVNEILRFPLFEFTRLTILQVTTKYLNGLIELIHSNLAGNQQDSASVENSKKHFYHTLEIIKSKEYEGVVLTPK